MTEKPEYRWPSLAPVIRQYVVRDDLGRYGIAYEDNCYHKDTLFAHPIDVMPTVSPAGVPGAESLPANAVLMTDTVFNLRGDGTYRGTWYDYNGVGRIPPEDLRTLTIIDDLGYVMPDKMAELFLAGSDQMGHWNSYWAASAGKKGGQANTPAQNAARAENAKKGGWPKGKPRKPKDNSEQAS